MDQKRIDEGRFTAHGRGLGTVTEEMVRRRARELAVINGREDGQVLDIDLDEARRELLGRERVNPTPDATETLSEEDRWHEVPEESGHKVEPVIPADEQTFAETLVEEGLEDAETENMLEATRESMRRDQI